MTDRVVKVSLIAQVSNYVSGFEQATKKTREQAKASEDASAAFEMQNQTMTRVGVGIVAFGALAAAGVAIAVKKFADFDQAMSNVAATGDDARENIDGLRDAALDAGARTVFSATEAANAIEELSKAGLTATQILGGGLDGALSLAAAGNLQVADAAGIAAIAVKQFNLEGSDVPHVADLLAAGAGKAVGDVSDLSAALGQAGLVANGAGHSIEETTGTLAAFADAGLIGSDAGTSLKAAIIALQAPTDKARGVMDKYNLSFYDANGKMLSFDKIAGQLETRLGGLDDETRNAALAQIFGNDALRVANVLYGQGEKGIQKYIKQTNDAGYAAETAAIRLDNLSGDLEQLGGAFDTALIKTGSAADGVLRGSVQAVTELVTAFGEAPLPIQQTALALAAVVAAAALAGGAFLIAVPKIAEFQVALATLSGSQIPGVAAAAASATATIGKMGTGLSAAAKFLTGPWGIALAAAAVGVKLLSDYLDSLQASSDEITNSLKSASSAAEIFATAGKGKDAKYFQDVNAALADLPGVLQASADQAGNLFARFDSSKFGAFDALKDVGEQLGTLASQDLPSAQKAFRLLSEETDGTEQSQWRLLNTMPGYKDALIAQATALDINVTSSDEAANKTNLLELAFGNAAPSALDAADAYLAAADQTKGLVDQVNDLIDAINEANGVGQDAVSANATFQGSLAGISDEVQKQKDAFIQLQKDGYLASHDSLEGFVGTLDGFSLSLDESTASGSANAAMLAGVAADAQTAAEAQYALDQKTMGGKEATDKYIATLATSRQSLIDQAIANGYNADQVQALADKVFGLPTQKEIDILADTSEAARRMDELIAGYQNRSVTLRAVMAGADANANGGMYAYAGGGFGSGIYAGRKGAIYKFAEPETRWEAFISGKPGQEERNRGIAIEALDRLGGLPGYAAQPQYVGSGMSSPTVNVAAPDLSGMRITGSLDLGNGLVGVIDGRIAASDSQRATVKTMGRRPNG